MVALPGRPDQFVGINSGTSADAFAVAWSQQRLANHPMTFTAVFTAERLKSIGPVKSVDPAEGSFASPLHYLLVDDAAEKRLLNAFRQVFDEDVHLSRVGEKLYFRVGGLACVEADRAHPRYLAELHRLPALHDQGDGMKSFVGCLLFAVVERHRFVVLIDEPEMFLHPPQAYLMGQLLAKETPKSRQLVMATHSGELLRGLLSADSDRLEVIRVTRKGAKGKVHHLANEQIRDLWDNPILRFSQALEGLFHDEVVVCEADTDCRFYSAVLDAIVKNGTLSRRPHVLFTHTGGKDRIPVMAKALHRVGVTTKVVADFDVLCDEKLLSGIVRALGGDWESMARDWRIVKTALDERAPPQSLGQVRSRINALFEAATGSVLDKKVAADVRDALKQGTFWGIAKSAGKAVVPQGDAAVALEKVLGRLREIGIHVVEVGELERFVPNVGAHGVAWLTDVLTQFNLCNSSSLNTAREFVTRVFFQEVVVPN